MGVDLLFEICRESEQVCMCETKTLVIYKMCVFTLLHIRLCWPLSSVCLQDLKIYVFALNCTIVD